MLDFNTDHKALVWTMFLVFLGLTIGVAIIPAFQMQDDYGPLPDQHELSQAERRGLEVYVAEGCAACHTQQVRNIEMDAVWGKRPAVAQDYFYSKKRLDVWRNSPSLLGSERTGPDLTDVGNRQPADAWQLLHLFEPRAVVKGSVMPSFRWLFKEVDSTMLRESDVVVNGIPKEYFDQPGKKIIATDDAMALVAYLESLKQVKLPEGMEVPEFIPLSQDIKEKAGTADTSDGGLDGATLYQNTCAACHQPTGKGLPGAFPPLDGSGIVNLDSPDTMIKIVLTGKNDDPDYGEMPAFGNQLSDEEIAAIISHERTSWSNDASKVTPDEVKKVRESL